MSTPPSTTTSSIPFLPADAFVVKETGLSQAQAITAYLGGSCFQTIMDNPVTAYRQLVVARRRDGHLLRGLFVGIGVFSRQGAAHPELGRE